MYPYTIQVSSPMAKSCPYTCTHTHTLLHPPATVGSLEAVRVSQEGELGELRAEVSVLKEDLSRLHGERKAQHSQQKSNSEREKEKMRALEKVRGRETGEWSLGVRLALRSLCSLHVITRMCTYGILCSVQVSCAINSCKYTCVYSTYHFRLSKEFGVSTVCILR